MSKAPKGYPDGRRLIGGHFPPAVAIQLNVLAAEQDMTVQAMLSSALDLLFAKHRKPSIGKLTESE